MSLPGFFNLIGLSHYTTNYTEKVISMVGGFLGIFCILLCSQWLLDPDVALMIVPSMGASAVLLFAAPHAPFSQPWNVIGGHGISAIVGGATALAAVIGSEKLHDLGYAYGYEPILLNAVSILLVAIAFNGLFRWRRYPAHLHVAEEAVESKVPGYEPIKHEDFVYALSHIDTFVDITEEDLLKIYERATRRHVESSAAQ
jgi:CBS-domain-containing membrane protein